MLIYSSIPSLLILSLHAYNLPFLQILPTVAFLFTARCYASAVLAMALCLSVCLSVTSRCSIETAERIELVFGTQASFHPSYTVLNIFNIGNSVISKNKNTSLWNFVLKCGLRIFRHGISIVDTCYQLS